MSFPPDFATFTRILSLTEAIPAPEPGYTEFRFNRDEWLPSSDKQSCWFEVSIIQSVQPYSTSPPKISRAVCSHPDDFASVLEDQGWAFRTFSNGSNSLFLPRSGIVDGARLKQDGDESKRRTTFRYGFASSRAFESRRDGNRLVVWARSLVSPLLTSILIQ